MMIHTPKALFDLYISQMILGQALSMDQQIKFAYLKKLFVLDSEYPIIEEPIEDGV